MRITSIFISTLLSALTVLVQGLDQYAGYRLPAHLGDRYKQVSANFRVPIFVCGLEEATAYLGVAIGGPPLICPGGGGIEAGVILMCQRHHVVYRPYWRTYPDTEHFGRSFPITPQNRVRVEVNVDLATGAVSVTIMSGENKFEPSPLGTVVQACTTTAGWWLRAVVGVDGELKPVPGFYRILMEHASATPFQGAAVGPRRAVREVIRNSREHTVITAEKEPIRNPSSVIIERY